MIDARRALRNGTHAAHGRVDDIYSRADLSRCDDYARFLKAQAAAFIPTEEALEEAGAGALLEDWPARRRARFLRADLLAVGAAVPIPIAAPVFSTAAEAWGGLYVIEGSRLGGALLRRSVSPDFPSAFLSAAAPEGGWRKLIQKLGENLTEPAEVALATVAAGRTFFLFEQAGLLFLSSKR